MSKSNHMLRRYGNGARASVANLQALETIINQVGCGFVPKYDPFEELSREIEKCSRKIWQCAGDRDPSQRQTKKARTHTFEEPVVQRHSHTVSETKKSPFPSVHKNATSEKSRMLIESRINSMKYRDIQVECKHFGLVATGNKEVLRERLLAHLLEEESQGKTDRAGEFDSKETREEMQADAKEEKDEAVHEVAAYDVEMKEDPSFFVDKEAPKHSDLDPAQQVEESLFPVRISCSSIQAEADVVMHEASEESRKVQVDQSCKDPPGKAIDDTAASVGPEDYVSRSPLAGFVKEALKSITQSAQKSKTHCADSIPEDDISPPPSDFTSSTESSKISGPSVRELVSKLSNPSNSALSKSVQAKKEARMARMAEMRGKSQQTKILSATKHTLSSTEYSSTLASLNATATSASSTKKNLAQQMREKALRKENAPANQMPTVHQAKSSAKTKATLSHAVVPDSLGATLKSGLGATMKYGSSSVKKANSPPKPAETYEISDREDSDSDDSETENEKRKKQIPSWAKKDQLYEALEAQYGCLDGRRLDPDLIFSEVDTCNLEAIFGSKMNTKYRNRTSSGNWSRDQVTAAEKLVYKRTMGFGTVETAEI